MGAVQNFYKTKNIFCFVFLSLKRKQKNPKLSALSCGVQQNAKSWDKNFAPKEKKKKKKKEKEKTKKKKKKKKKKKEEEEKKKK